MQNILKTNLKKLNKMKWKIKKKKIKDHNIWKCWKVVNLVKFSTNEMAENFSGDFFFKSNNFLVEKNFLCKFKVAVILLHTEEILTIISALFFVIHNDPKKRSKKKSNKSLQNAWEFR